jgi:hypothetical protein
MKKLKKFFSFRDRPLLGVGQVARWSGSEDPLPGLRSLLFLVKADVCGPVMIKDVMFGFAEAKN